MKKVLYSIFVVLIITSVNTFSEGNKAANQETEYFDFPLSIGNQWTYSYKSSDTEEVDNATIYIDTVIADRSDLDYPYFALKAKEDNENAEFMLMKNTNKHLAFTNQEQELIFELLKYPLKKSGNTSFYFGGPKLVFTVAEINEEIEVAAGKFNCVRVDVYIGNENMKLGSVWLAHNIGVAKFAGQTPDGESATVELTDYKIMGR